MKRQILGIALLIGAVALSASTALAYNGLNLSFDDCSGGAPVTTKTWTCTNSGTAFTAVASVTMGTADAAAATHLTGEAATLEVAFSTAVPSWWLNTCRPANQFAVGFNGGAFACFDYFGQAALGGIVSSSTYVTGPSAADGDPNGPIDANRLRVRTVSAVNFDNALLQAPPVAGDEVFLFSLTVTKQLTTTCSGCSQQSCIMLKNATITQTSGSNLVYDLQGASSFPTISGQSATPDCVTVPAQTRTWGQIKALYR
jgi:hypothetical protein